MHLNIERNNICAPCLKRADSPRVESLLEKGSGKRNEDVLLREGPLYGVFDGATSLVEDNLPAGLSGGLLAARIAAEVFQHYGLRHSLSRCAALANSQIGHSMRLCGIPGDQKHKLWSTSAAVLRLGAAHFEYCQTGDSLIFCLYEDGGYRQLTPGTDQDRRTLNLWKMSEPAPGATIRETLAEEILAVRQQMNLTYGVLNGEPQALSFLNCGRESLEGVSDLLLFTDGLFPPQKDPCAETDWDEFIELYRLGGLSALRNRVRGLQAEDPECREFPRFKMHDDIAAIAVRI